MRAPRWEWRTFGPSFAMLDPLMPSAAETVHETFVVSAAADANVRIRGDRIAVETIETVRDGLELWRPRLDAQFPLCQRDVRAVLRCLEVPLPRALFLPSYTAADFVTDVACCLNGIRVIGVQASRRHAIVDNCIVERASVHVAGEVWQTAAIESADATAVLRQIRRFGFDHCDRVNYVEWLKRLVGAVPSMQEVHHETLAL